MNPVNCWKAQSWPRGLGYGSGFENEGLGISFGWHARGTIWQAYRQAEVTGRALAHLIRSIRKTDPDREIRLMGHSLGARVILSSLLSLDAGDVDRVILLNAAEYGHAADLALGSPAGQNVELFSVTTRENDLFDFLFERIIAPPVRGDRCLAQSLGNSRNALTIEIDRRRTRRALFELGYSIAPPDTRICHWSAYLRPGVFDLYRALLRMPHLTRLNQLKEALPKRHMPRWSRVIGLSDIEAVMTEVWPEPAISFPTASTSRGPRRAWFGT
jgi:pimeloyl-ACP methyl ester carboxylesterase